MTYRDCANIEQQASRFARNIGIAIEFAKMQTVKERPVVRMELKQAEELKGLLDIVSAYFGVKLDSAEVPRGRNKKRSARKHK